MRQVRLATDCLTDPRLRLLARRTGHPLATIMAVWVTAMTHAGRQHGSRWGTLHGWDDEAMAIMLDVEDQVVTDVRQAMEGRLVEDGSIIDWHHRQRRDVTAKLRMARMRQRRREAAELERRRLAEAQGVTAGVTPVTPVTRNTPLHTKVRAPAAAPAGAPGAEGNNYQGDSSPPHVPIPESAAAASSPPRAPARIRAHEGMPIFNSDDNCSPKKHARAGEGVPPAPEAAAAQAGKPGGGEERAPLRLASSRPDAGIPTNWTPSEESLAWVAAHRPGVDTGAELARFRARYARDVVRSPDALWLRWLETAKIGGPPLPLDTSPATAAAPAVPEPVEAPCLVPGQEAPWRAVHEALRDRLGMVEYRSWCQGLVLQEISGGLAVVAAPSRFIRDWVRSRHEHVLRHLCAQHGLPDRLELAVAPPVGAAGAGSRSATG